MVIAVASNIKNIKKQFKNYTKNVLKIQRDISSQNSMKIYNNIAKKMYIEKVYNVYPENKYRTYQSLQSWKVEKEYKGKDIEVAIGMDKQGLDPKASNATDVYPAFFEDKLYPKSFLTKLIGRKGRTEVVAHRPFLFSIAVSIKNIVNQIIKKRLTMGMGV